MNEVDWKRLVIVTAKHGEKYIGYVPPEIENPPAYMDEHATAGASIQLCGVRNLIGQVSIDPSGKVSKFNFLLPIDVMSGPMPVLRLVPSSWYFPSENGEACQTKMQDMINLALESEIRSAAAEAGIVTDGVLPTRRRQ